MRHILKHHGRYVFRHEDLIAIAGECGGQILSLFEFWTSCRLAEQDRVRSLNKQLAAKGKQQTKEPDNWLLETIEDIRAGLMDGWGISSIKRALKELVAAGYVLEGKAKNPWLRTKTYQLNIQEVQKALDAWQDKQSGILSEVSNPLVSEELISTHRAVDFNSSSGLNEPQTIYINNPLKHSQPEEQSPVCVRKKEEEEELRSQEKIPTNQSSFVPQIRNPEPSTLQPAAGGSAVPSAKWESVESLIESILVDPYIEPTDSIPSAVKSEMRSRGWLFPWRSRTRDNMYQTCNQELVDHIAKERASWGNEPTYKQKIPGVIGWIGENERTKAGLEKIMAYWSIVKKQAEKDNPAPQQQTENKPEPPVAIDPNLDPDILLESEWRDPQTQRRMRKTERGDILGLMEIGQGTGNYKWVVMEKAPKQKSEESIRARENFKKTVGII
jgi:hypothetical protein